MGHCQPNSKNIPCGCIHQQVISLSVEVYIPLGHFHIIGVSFVIYDALSSWLDLSKVRLGWLITLISLKRMTRGWSGQGPSPSRTNKLTQFMQKSPLNALYQWVCFLLLFYHGRLYLLTSVPLRRSSPHPSTSLFEWSQ